MYDTTSGQDGDCALYVPCSLVQLARVVVCVCVLVDVLCVMVVVLIGRHTVGVVGAVLVAIFVVIFCNWRCTLYRLVTNEEESLTKQFTMLITLRCTLTQSVLLGFRCGDTSSSTRKYLKANWEEP